MKSLKKENSLRKEIDISINFWHQFPFEWWWRQRYNVSFGSQKHRQMNLIDMYWEYVEALRMSKINEDNYEDDFEEDENIVIMTQNEIDQEYENLDLTQFDI